MKTYFYIKFLIVSFLLIQVMPAASKPASVHAFLASEKLNKCLVGEKVSVIVEVLSPTYFSGSTRFSLPDIAGAVLYKPEERAVVMNRDIDGVTYSVQRHEFSFYAQRPGDFKIPPFRVRFGIQPVAGATIQKEKQPQECSEQTKAIQIKASMPPGAEHLKSLVSTTLLKVTETWNPGSQTNFTAGNAIQRKITFSASEVPAMVLPALLIPKIDGVQIYRDRAQINDQISRGALTGERTDKITYIFQKPGNYTFPEIQITWWDLQHKKIQVITLPAKSFEVLPAPNQNNNSSSPRSTIESLRSLITWKTLGGTLLILLGLGAGIFYFRTKISEKITCWKQQRRESESAYFKKITLNLSPSATHYAIIQWLACISAQQDNFPTLSDWARSENNDNLLKHAEALQRAMVDPHSTWDAHALIQELKLARAKQQRKKSTQRNPLESLNP